MGCPGLACCCVGAGCVVSGWALACAGWRAGAGRGGVSVRAGPVLAGRLALGCPAGRFSVGGYFSAGGVVGLVLGRVLERVLERALGGALERALALGEGFAAARAPLRLG